jgi:hypothetical protein
LRVSGQSDFCTQSTLSVDASFHPLLVAGIRTVGGQVIDKGLMFATVLQLTHTRHDLGRDAAQRAYFGWNWSTKVSLPMSIKATIRQTTVSSVADQCE